MVSTSFLLSSLHHLGHRGNQASPPRLPLVNTLLTGCLLLTLLIGFSVSLSGCWQAPNTPPPAGGPNGGGGIPVSLHTIEAAPVEQPTLVLGRVDMDTSLWLRPRVMAHVVSIPVSTGQVVQAGQTLIVLDAARQQGIAAASQQQLLVQDEAIRVAEASITAQEARTQASQAELKRANNELRRATALLQQQALAPADYDTAKRNADQAYATVEANLSELNASIARLNLAKAQRNSLLEQARGEQNEANLYRLQAPFTGKIGDILPKVGELVAPTADMIELTRQLNPIVKAQISVEASKHITVGMKARIVDEQQQPIATASVLSLSDRVSLESQTRLVRLKITTHTTDFYQGQYVRAELIPPSQTQVVIPFELVTFMAGQPFAYVAQHPEPAKKATAATMPSSGEWVVGLRPLTLGSMVNNSYIVKQGLRSGDRIIASSLQKLQPNAPIQLLPEAASPQATPATSTSSSSTVGH